MDSKKISVEEELEYWGITYLTNRMLKYGRKLLFNKNSQLWGQGLEDMVNDVFYKVLSGERSWEDSDVKDFVGFLLNCLHSEIGNYLKKEANIYKNQGRESYYLKNKEKQDTFVYNSY